MGFQLAPVLVTLNDVEQLSCNTLYYTASSQAHSVDFSDVQIVHKCAG